MRPPAPPGTAGRRLAELGDGVVLRDLYDEHGSAVYHSLAGGDTHEIRELVRAVRPVPGPVLELGAGSGRHTLPLLALGREVTALDLSEGMLELLSARLRDVPALRDRCTVVHGDMTAFSLGRRFGVIVLGTTSVSLLDERGRAGLYAAVREHLAPGGVFLLSTVEVTPEAAEQVEFEQAFLDPRTDRGHVLYEYIGAGSRTVTILPAEPGPGPVDGYTTTIRMLSAELLTAELADAGIAVRTRHPLPAPSDRHRAVLLEAEVSR
jgi:methylation protein MtfA